MDGFGMGELDTRLVDVHRRELKAPTERQGAAKAWA